MSHHLNGLVRVADSINANLEKNELVHFFLLPVEEVIFSTFRGEDQVQRRQLQKTLDLGHRFAGEPENRRLHVERDHHVDREARSNGVRHPSASQVTVRCRLVFPVVTWEPHDMAIECVELLQRGV